MIEINVDTIKETVRKLCIEACTELPLDVRKALEDARGRENSDALTSDRSCSKTAVAVLDTIIENYRIAESDRVPICQDTGMTCVFAEIGQDVHLTGGDFEEAVNQGVAEAYVGAFLRKSVVTDPIRRGNTGDNTPAMIYETIVPGETVKLTVAPKGFGSENMSAIRMLKPAAGLNGVRNFILETVKKAGPNPCPPIVVGVGIGGTFDKCANLAKKALLRPIGERNPDPYYADLERELYEKINELNIGPQGFGGLTTALAVHIETLPTHIAGLPVAVNINCHVSRHKSAVISGDASVRVETADMTGERPVDGQTGQG